MKLYHGTNESNVAKIQLKGVQPRQKRKSQWEDYPSRPDMVYLTTAYALYFAMNSKGKERYAMLEIESDELDQSKLYPDEDFIAQALAQSQKGKLFEIHQQVKDNLEIYQDCWQQSIYGLGNCCYKGTIPFSAVQRICYMQPGSRMYIEIMGIDPSISILNYSILGEKYRNLIAWLFGDRKSLPEPFASFPTEQIVKSPHPMNENWIQMIQQEKAMRETESSDRSGIEIQNLLN